MRKYHSLCKRLLAILALAVFSSFLAACATVPGTGRSQLSLIDDATINRESALAYSQMISQGHLSSNRAETAMIKRVGDRIAKAAQVLMAEYGQSDRLKDYNWEFNLIDSDEINAFCMAGGKVAFYTGILPICKDENGVATVMGHEVAHALARHGAERASQQMAAGIGSTVLELALGASSVSPGTGQAIMIAYGLGAQYGVLLPYSRAHEAEADRIGLSLMALAGYDPRRSLEFWQRMSAATGNSGSSFFQTHPSDQERMANIQEYINEALQRAEANHVKFTD